MAIKELQTRIALKYDSYENWASTSEAGKGGNLVLLPGELGICEIPAVQAGVSNVAPTVLFKVGGAKYPTGHEKAGQLMAFKDLPWASAKAADVYGWAKSETVVLDGTAIKFKTGDKVNHSIDLSSFATDAEVESIRSALDARIVAIENSVGSNGDIGKSVADHESRLDVIEGADTVDGSIAKALKDAKAYADAADQGYELELKNYAGQKATTAENTAKKYTDAEVKKVADALDLDEAALAAHIADKDNPHEVTKAQVGLGNVDNKSVATIKSEFTGTIAANDTGFVTGGAAHTAIEAAKTAANSYADGLNTAMDARVDVLEAAQTAMDTAYKAADTEIKGRLNTVEGKLANVTNVMDFRGAVEALPAVASYQDGDVIVVTAGDNKGKEYVLSNGAWVEFGNTDANSAAISALQGRMTTAEGDIDKLEGRADALEAADAALGQRIDGVITDYTEADADTLAAAKRYADSLDTTMEQYVHDYVSGKVTQAETAAKDAAKTYTDGQVATLTAADAAMSADITALKQVTNGYSGDKAIKTAVDAKLATDTFNSWKNTHETDHAKTATKIAEDIAAAVKTETDNRVAAVSGVDAKAVAVAARVDAYDTYFGVAEGVFPTTLIFNCGTATTVTEQ